MARNRTRRVLDRRRDLEDNVIPAVYVSPAPGGRHYVETRSGGVVEASGEVAYKPGTDVQVARGSRPGSPPVILPSIPLGRASAGEYQRTIEQPGEALTPLPEPGTEPPATLWVYYYDPGTHSPGVNGTLYCYAYEADGTPVGEVGSVAAPATGGFGDYVFDRDSLLLWSSPNVSGVLTLWDTNGQQSKSWLWTPDGALQTLTWSGFVQLAPVLHTDGFWYWLSAVSGGWQLRKSADDYVGSDVGSVGTMTTVDELTTVWISGGYYCVDQGASVVTVPLSGHGGGAFPTVASSLDGTAKDASHPDSDGNALQPQQTTSELTWVRRVDKTGAEVGAPWPESGSWARATGVDVYVCVQRYNTYYVASGLDNFPSAADLHVIVGAIDAEASDSPTQDFTLGAHPDHAGVYPSLVMAVG